MKRVAVLAAAALALAGCGTQTTTAEAPIATASPETPRLGAADEMGWMLYSHDRVMAGGGSAPGPVYATHPSGD